MSCMAILKMSLGAVVWSVLTSHDPNQGPNVTVVDVRTMTWIQRRGRRAMLRIQTQAYSYLVLEHIINTDKSLPTVSDIQEKDDGVGALQAPSFARNRLSRKIREHGTAQLVAWREDISESADPQTQG